MVSRKVGYFEVDGHDGADKCFLLSSLSEDLGLHFLSVFQAPMLYFVCVSGDPGEGAGIERLLLEFSLAPSDFELSVDGSKGLVKGQELSHV